MNCRTTFVYYTSFKGRCASEVPPTDDFARLSTLGEDVGTDRSAVCWTEEDGATDTLGSAEDDVARWDCEALSKDGVVWCDDGTAAEEEDAPGSAGSAEEADALARDGAAEAENAPARDGAAAIPAALKFWKPRYCSEQNEHTPWLCKVI